MRLGSQVQLTSFGTLHIRLILVTVDRFCYIYKTFTQKIDLDYLTMQKYTHISKNFHFTDTKLSF